MPKVHHASKQLNHLALLNVHVEKVDLLNIIDIGNDFVYDSGQRRSMFRKFTYKDKERMHVSMKAKSTQTTVSTIVTNSTVMKCLSVEMIKRTAKVRACLEKEIYPFHQCTLSSKNPYPFIFV